MSFGFAVLMITVFRGCLALSICPRFLWKFLPLSQHLSNSHVDAGGLQVLGTHLPILIRAVLNHWANRKVWRRSLVEAWRQSCPLRVGEDSGDSVVQQAAEAGHHHDISAVHEHCCWGLLPLQAPKQKYGGLPKTRDGVRIEREEKENSGREQFFVQ